MKKNELISMLEDYKKVRGLVRRHFSRRQIDLLKKFLFHSEIKWLSDEDTIGWDTFKLYVKEKNEDFDKLFSEKYLKGDSASAKLFLRFKNSGDEVELTELKAENSTEKSEKPIEEEVTVLSTIYGYLDNDTFFTPIPLERGDTLQPNLMKKTLWDRLKLMGLSEELLESLKKTRKVSDYYNLCVALEKTPISFRKTVITELWQLLALSGETDALEYAFDEKQASEQTRDSQGLSIIHYAALSGNPEQLEKALSLGGDLGKLDAQGRSAMHYAALSGNPEQLKKAVSLGGHLRQTDAQDRNAMHYACWSGRTKVVDYCIDKGLQTRMEDNEGNTAIYYAVRSGSIEQVKHVANNFMSYHLKVDRSGLSQYTLGTAAGAACGALFPPMIPATILLFWGMVYGLSDQTAVPFHSISHSLIKAAIESHDAQMIEFIGEKYSYKNTYESQTLLRGKPDSSSKFWGMQIEAITKTGVVELFKKSSEIFSKQEILGIRPSERVNANLLDLAIESGSIDLVEHLLTDFDFKMEENSADFAAVRSGCPDMLEKVARALRENNADYRLDSPNWDVFVGRNPNPLLMKAKLDELRADFRASLPAAAP